jgi:hypothetical protein
MKTHEIKAAWELSHKGKFWHHMPGQTDFEKKIHFFFFRRGKYHPERPVAERWQQRPNMFTYPGRIMP